MIRNAIVLLLVVASGHLVSPVVAPSVVLRAAQRQGTPPAPAVEEPVSTLPGGAASLQETHGDWRVTCAQPNGKKVCALSQQQTEKDSRMLMLAIELNAPAKDQASGTLILPFGLAVDRPITMLIDEAPAPPIVALLRKGTVLTLKATADNGQEAAFMISLKGFSGALDRTATLAQ